MASGLPEERANRCTNEPYRHYANLGFEAAGAELPADRQIDGLSLLPGAQGQAGLPERPIFFHSGINHALRMGDWKLQVNDLEGGPWLYNLSKDPTEQKNLAPAYPEKLLNCIT